MSSTTNVNFSDIVATLLKSITIARIKSDIFSNQASVEYLRDPNLQNYPIPRVEIREAEVDMKFTVVETQDKAVDIEAIVHQVVRKALPDHVNCVLTVPARQTQDGPYLPLGDIVRAALRAQLGLPPPPAELTAPQQASLDQAVLQVRDAIVVKLDDYLWQNKYLYQEKLIDNPHRFATDTVKPKALEHTSGVLTARGIAALLNDPAFTRAVEQESIVWSLAIQSDSIRAVDLAKAEFFGLDLAVKRDQLEHVPEHVISGVKLSFVVENYEWTTIQDKQGNLTRKLTRK